MKKINTTIQLLEDNENKREVKEIERRYRVETAQEYGVWLSTFERMLTRVERCGMRSEKQRKTEQYYNRMIRSLKHSMKTNGICEIVENDSHMFYRFHVISC